MKCIYFKFRFNSVKNITRYHDDLTKANKLNAKTEMNRRRDTKLHQDFTVEGRLEFFVRKDNAVSDDSFIHHRDLLACKSNEC